MWLISFKGTHSAPMFAFSVIQWTFFLFFFCSQNWNTPPIVTPWKKILTGPICRWWLEFVCTSELQCLTFIFVPGNADIKCNEKADSPVGRATVINGRTMDHVDILNGTRDTGYNKISDGEVNSTSLTWLLPHVKVEAWTAVHGKWILAMFTTNLS